MAISLRKKGSDRWEQFDAKTATDLYGSGEWEIKADEGVPIHSSEGIVKANPGAKGFHDAFFEYGGFASTDEVMEQKKETRKEKYGARPVEAFVRGAADTATFGVSTAVSGLIDPERTREVAEQNPAATMAGQVAGAVAPGGLVAAAEKAAAKGLSKGAAKLLGREISERAAAVGGAALAGAAEGATYGAGNYVSETFLGKTDATAEGALKHIGAMAAVGGLAGGAVEAASGAIKAGVAARRAGKQVDVPKVSKEGVAKHVEKTTGMEISDEMSDAIATTINKAGDDVAKPVTIKNVLTDRKLRRRVLEGEAFSKTGAADLKTDLTKLADDNAVFRKLSGREIRVDKVGKYIDNANWEKTLDEARVMAKNLADEGADQKAISYIARDLGKSLEEAASSPRQKEAVFRAVYKAKVELGDIAAASKKTDRNLFAVAGRQLDSFKNHLLDDGHYGKMAEFQKEIDPLISWMGSNQEHIDKMFMAKSGRKLGFGEATVVNPAKIETFVKNIGKTKGENPSQIFRDNLEIRKQLIKTYKKYADLAPEELKALEKASQTVSDLDKKLSRINRSVSEYNTWSELTRRGGMVDTILSGASMAGGGMVGGLAQRFINAPDLALRAMSHIDRITTDGQTRMAGRVVNWVKSSAQSGKQAAKKSAGTAAKSMARRVPLASYDEIVDKIFNGSNSQENTEPRLREVMPSLEYAPETAAKAAMRINGAMDYLKDKIPADTLRQLGTPSLLRRKADVPDFEKQRFLRLVEVLNDPEAAIDRLEEGRLTKDEVEILKITYPETYNNLVSSVMAGIADGEESGDPMPFSKKIQLGILLGTPIDATMDPKFMAALQSVKVTEQTEGPGVNRTVTTSIKSDSLANIYKPPGGAGLESYTRR